MYITTHPPDSISLLLYVKFRNYDPQHINQLCPGLAY